MCTLYANIINSGTKNARIDNAIVNKLVKFGFAHPDVDIIKGPLFTPKLMSLIKQQYVITSQLQWDASSVAMHFFSIYPKDSVKASMGGGGAQAHGKDIYLFG